VPGDLARADAFEDAPPEEAPQHGVRGRSRHEFARRRCAPGIPQGTSTSNPTIFKELAALRPPIPPPSDKSAFGSILELPAKIARLEKVVLFLKLPLDAL